MGILIQTVGVSRYKVLGVGMQHGWELIYKLCRCQDTNFWGVKIKKKYVWVLRYSLFRCLDINLWGVGIQTVRISGGQSVGVLEPCKI